MATLRCECQMDMDCPKEVVIWNYYDHEHVVGTHYKWYHRVRVVAEQDGWCLVERSYRLPIIQWATSSLGFMFLENPNLIRSFQFGRFGLRMEQDIRLDDLGPDRCRVVSTYRLEVPFFLKVLQPLFRKITTRWFWNTWDEDAPMRLRRWKVWKLGFRDFSGLAYVNKKTARSAETATRDAARPCTIELPVPKSTSIVSGGVGRPFSKSAEVGY